MNEFEDRLRKMEAELIEQEHRPVKVITNYLNRKKAWPEDDERQMAAKKAIIWRLFFSPGAIAASGGIIAILTLLILFTQTKILKNQNILIEEQNIFFRRQVLTNEVYKNKEIVYDSHGMPNDKSRAVRNLIQLYLEINPNDSSFKDEFESTDLSLCNFSHDSTLIHNVNFARTYLHGTNFEESNLTKCDFTGAIMTMFPEKNIMPANFQNCTLVGANLSDANLSGVNFSGANLKGIKYSKIKKSKTRNAIFINVKYLPQDFRTKAEKDSVVIFEIDQLKALIADKKSKFRNLTNYENTGLHIRNTDSIYINWLNQILINNTED